MLQPLIFPLQQPGTTGATPFLIRVLPTEAMPQAYSATVSGGVQFDGSATTAPVKIYGYIASGGLQTTGAALVAKIKSMVAAGVLAIFGSADTSISVGHVDQQRNRTSMSIRIGIRR